MTNHMNWRTAPLAAFDTETTGVGLDARIVTACIVTITPDNNGPDSPPTVQAHEWLLNPGIEIPDGAAKIHGITTEHAQQHGQDYTEGYNAIRATLEDCWAQGYLLVAFNGSFDLGVMHHEGRRLWHPDLTVPNLLDPYVVDRALDPYRRGSRKLTAMVQHYGVRMDPDNAHTASEDALAAARLAWKLRNLIPNMTLNELMRHQATAHHTRQTEYAEWRTRQGNPTDDIDPHWPIRGVDTTNTLQGATT